MKKWIAIVALCALPSQALAQTAQEHFDKGAEWYAGGEYSKAIVEFLKGYNLEPNAMFLYNISLSYAKLANFEEALNYAERARTESGMPDEVQVRNDGRIAALRTRFHTIDAARHLGQVAAEPPQESPEPESKSGFGALGISGVVLSVAGLGLVGGAWVVNSDVETNLDALKAEANGGDRAEFDRLKTQVEDDQSLGQILLLSGLGLTAVGVTMVALDLSDDDEPRRASLKLVPSTTSTQAVLTFTY